MLRSKKFAVVISYLNLFVSLITTVFFIPFLLLGIGGGVRGAYTLIKNASDEEKESDDDEKKA